MKEIIIFFLIFLLVLGSAFIIFNGRFFYSQLKYSTIGPKQLTLSHTTEQVTNNEQGTILLEKLVIPSIGVDTPVTQLAVKDEYTLQKALEKGVVLYPDSNIILGHSSAYPWYKGEYGSVFSLLNKLEKEDKILIFSKDKKYTYQVIDKEIKMPKDLNIEDKEDILYLMSCWPVNTNRKRIAIKAIRVDTE